MVNEMLKRTLGNRRQWLRASVRKYLLPVLAQHGFKGTEWTNFDQYDKELATTMPFGVHYRETCDGRFQLEVDMVYSSGPPQLRISFGRAPSREKDYTPIDWQDSDIYVLHKCPFLQSNFRLSWWKERRAQEYDYDQLVISIIAKLPQINEMLDNGRQGPNVHVWPGSGYPIISFNDDE